MRWLNNFRPSALSSALLLTRRQYLYDFLIHRQLTWVKSLSQLCLVTTDEIPEPQQLQLKTWLNGEIVQQDSTANMVHSIHKIISYMSTFTQLSPGEVILTGSPGGVGSASLVMSVSESMNMRRFGMSRSESFQHLLLAAAILKNGGRANDGIVLQLIDCFCLHGIGGVTTLKGPPC